MPNSEKLTLVLITKEHHKKIKKHVEKSKPKYKNMREFVEISTNKQIENDTTTTK